VSVNVRHAVYMQLRVRCNILTKYVRVTRVDLNLELRLDLPNSILRNECVVVSTPQNLCQLVPCIR